MRALLSLTTSRPNIRTTARTARLFSLFQRPVCLSLRFVDQPGGRLLCCLRITRHAYRAHLSRIVFPSHCFMIFLLCSFFCSCPISQISTFVFTFSSFLHLFVTLYQKVRAHIQNCMMSACLYFCLASFLVVNADDSLLGNNGLPSPPASVSGLTPLGNAAAWHEAVTIDSARNLSSGIDNKYFYSEVAYWQSLENNSNSYLSGSVDPSAGALVSQVLQYLRLYPMRFDQAQASDPKQTPSKQSLECSSFLANGRWCSHNHTDSSTNDKVFWCIRRLVAQRPRLLPFRSTTESVSAFVLKGLALSQWLPLQYGRQRRP